ncbi:MAG TPA: CATRA conflict system CASPASE/TPR repeat-associated protein, partial [Streptosporangiaceae bacterium]|nr:CATRA conflict system CASPASE/TPR repeat-associated protein [Streptosporangiaceae bacterium]
MTTILDQQFVAHIFAPAAGPSAAAAYEALRAIWTGCGQLYQMTDPISESGLPLLLPETLESRPAGAEIVLATRERPGAAACQAVLRLHHDVLNLSVGMTHSADAGDGWASFDFSWNLLCASHAGLFLGEARLFLARLDATDSIGEASPVLYQALSPLLPSTAVGGQDPSAGVSVGGEFCLWETAARPDERSLRRFVAAVAPAADPAASSWVWSGGDAGIPPFARYLLHAAKLRYELRVWQRDSQARQLQAALDSLSTEIAQLETQDPQRAALLAVRSKDAKRLSVDLSLLRQTVDIAADNMTRSVDLTGLMVPGGPFADDADLARSLLVRLRDEISYLELAIAKADLVPDTARPALHAAEHGLNEDLKRNVFVVYGRDEEARLAIFEFLRALDLRPLQWESVVSKTGSAAPSLSNAVRIGLQICTAVVVLMTAEDIVRLHPDLHERTEGQAEATDSMQARPNVLLELGMALAVKPDQTLILLFGQQRPVTDLGGLNYIQIQADSDWRSKVAGRLGQAGCPVDLSGQDWRQAG